MKNSGGLGPLGNGKGNEVPANVQEVERQSHRTRQILIAQKPAASRSGVSLKGDLQLVKAKEEGTRGHPIGGKNERALRKIFKEKREIENGPGCELHHSSAGIPF